MNFGKSIQTQIARLALLVLAVSMAGFNPAQAQNDPPPGQIQQNGCCPNCRQPNCRCLPRFQFVNPNQFLCDPACDGQGPLNYFDATSPPAAGDSALSQSLGDQPGMPPSDQSGAQPFNPPTQDSSGSFAISTRLGSGNEAIGFRETTIGDFFGGGSYIAGPSWGGVTFLSPVSAGDRRFKLTEHTSPLPSNRVFFNYNLFSNALTDANGNELDLDRYTFGLEKTLFKGNASLELRIPILDGTNSEQIQMVGGPPNRNTEFGNMSLTTKFLLAQRNGWTYSSGLGIIFPTADAAVLVSQSGSTGVEVEIANEAYYLQPFFAVQRNPNQYSWINFFTQFDFAAQGNTVTVTEAFANQPRSQIYNDQHLLFLDLSMGRWLYQANPQTSCLHGVAGIFELHYTTTLNDTDVVSAGLFDDGPLDTLSDPANRRDVLNATLGLRFLVGERSSLTVSGVAPLRADEDHLFDSEFSLQYSRMR